MKLETRQEQGGREELVKQLRSHSGLNEGARVTEAIAVLAFQVLARENSYAEEDNRGLAGRRRERIATAAAC